MAKQNDDGSVTVTGGYTVDSEESEGDSVTLSSLGISWITDLRIIADKPQAWIVATLTAFSVQEAYAEMSGDDGASAVKLIVEEYLYQQVLLPAATAIWDAGIAMLGSVLTIFLGSDHALGIGEGSQYGIADIPFAIYQPVIDAVDTGSTEFVTELTQFNEFLASQLAFAGLAGPAVVTFFWLVELLGLLWLLWVVINIFDPGIVVSTAKALVRPLRNALEWIYE